MPEPTEQRLLRRRAFAESAETVAVFGVGGLGHLAVQYARLVGAQVIAVDIDQDKLDLATTLGADHVVNSRKVDPVAAIQALGGADVSLAFAVSPEAFEQAFSSLSPVGRLVRVAMPAAGTMSIPIFETVVKGIQIIGSIVVTHQDLHAVFELQAAGRTRVIAEGRKLDDVNQSMDEVLSGSALARLVFEF